MLADRSRTTRQRRSQKFNEAETVSIYLFAARRFRGGAAGAPGGGGEEARSENTVSSRSILGTRRARDREREIEIDRDREREISSRAYLYPPEFLARPSPLSLLSLGRRIVDDRG